MMMLKGWNRAASRIAPLFSLNSSPFTSASIGLSLLRHRPFVVSRIAPSLFSKCSNVSLLFNTTSFRIPSMIQQLRYFSSNIVPSDETPTIEQARNLFSEGYQKQVDGKLEESLVFYKKCIDLYLTLLDHRVQLYRETTKLYTRKAGKRKGLEVLRSAPQSKSKTQQDKEKKNSPVFTIEDEVRLIMGKPLERTKPEENENEKEKESEEFQEETDDVLVLNAENLGGENEKIDIKRMNQQNQNQEDDDYDFEEDDLVNPKVSMDDKLKNKFQESYELAIAYLNYGELLDNLERPADSEAACRESLSILELGVESTIEENEEKFEEKLYNKQRTSPQEREWSINSNEEIIAIAKGNLAEYMIKQKNYVEAIPLARNAFEILLNSRGRNDPGTKEYFMLLMLSFHQAERGEEVQEFYEEYKDVAESIQEGAPPEMQEKAEQYLVKFWNKFTNHVSDEDIDKMEKMGIFNTEEGSKLDDLVTEIENQNQDQSKTEKEGAKEEEDGVDDDLFIEGLDKGTFGQSQEPEPNFTSTFELAGAPPMRVNSKGEMTEIEDSPLMNREQENENKANSDPQKTNDADHDLGGFKFTDDPLVNEMLSKLGDLSRKYEGTGVKADNPFDEKPETAESQSILNEAIDILNVTSDNIDDIGEDNNKNNEELAESVDKMSSLFEHTTSEIMNDLKDNQEKESLKRDFGEIEKLSLEKNRDWVEDHFSPQEKEKLNEWMSNQFKDEEK